MKTYFAKYLPVEGEIKEGDYIPRNAFPHFPVKVTAIKEKHYVTDEEELHDPFGGSFYTVAKSSEVKKLKLFLCSYYKDGEMLPKFEGPGGYTYEIQHNQQYDGKVLKVIGEISADATWVKEGDELTEEDCLVDHLDGHFVTSIGIRCPNCKTFH